MPYVRYTPKAWEVAEGDRVLFTAGGTSRGDLARALDVARDLIITTPKETYFRGADHEEIGVFRWLPAAEEESSPIRGVRIDAQAIRELADSLNKKTIAVGIDGGPAPPGMAESGVHGTAFDSGTPVNGWAHWAVVCLDAGGQTELWLWSELLPHIAAEVDMGRLGHGSVHFGWQSLEGADLSIPRGCELISHALTNDPAVTTLAPNSSAREGTPLTGFAVRSASIAGRVLQSPQRGRRGGAMSKSLRARWIELGVNEIALAKLAALAPLVGLSADAPLTDEQCNATAIRSLLDPKTAAAVEKIGDLADLAGAAAVRTSIGDVEDLLCQLLGVSKKELPVRLVQLAGAAGTPPKAAAAPSEEEMAARESADKPAGDATRAVEGLEGPALEAFAADAITLMREALDLPADAPVALLEKLRASIDLIRNAIGATPDAAGLDATLQASRARAPLATIAADAALLIPLQKAKRAIDAGAAVDTEITRRKMRVTTEQRSQYVELAVKYGHEAALSAIAAAHAPPMGTVMRATPLAGTTAPAADTWGPLHAAASAEIAKAHPEWPRHMVWAAANKTVRKAHPTLEEPGAA